MDSGAPRSANSGSIVSTPMTEMMTVMMNDRIRLSVASLRARRRLPEPSARATTDEVPAPSPMATLVTTIRIGNAKLSAASASSPTRPINHASTNAWPIIMKMPNRTGTVMLTRCRPTEPSVSRACVDFICFPESARIDGR